MRPIKSDKSKEADDLLKKAEYLLKKAEDLDMIEHEGEDVPAFVADGKGPNDKKSKKSKSILDLPPRGFSSCFCWDRSCPNHK